MKPRHIALLAALLVAAGLQLPVLAAAFNVRGGVLVDAGGFTLYTFEQDGPDTSRCYESCAASWPAFQAQPGAVPRGDFGVFARGDGSRQWSYRGMPLYRYARDQSPGDQRGDRLADRWHVLLVRKVVIE